MTQDAQWRMVHKTGSSTDKKQHAVGCEYIHTVVNGRQLTVYHTAGVWQELRDQSIAAHNGKPRWLTEAFVHTVHEIEHHDAARSGNLADKSPDKHPREGTKQVLITLEEATAAYMVEVIVASQCLKQQLMSCRCSTCLLR